MYKVLDCVFFSSNELRNFGLWQSGWRKKRKKKKEALFSWVFANVSERMFGFWRELVCVGGSGGAFRRQPPRFVIATGFRGRKKKAACDVNVEAVSQCRFWTEYIHRSVDYETEQPETRLELFWTLHGQKMFWSSVTRLGWQTQHHRAVTFHLVPCHEEKTAILSSPGQQSVFGRPDCRVKGQKRKQERILFSAKRHAVGAIQ